MCARSCSRTTIPLPLLIEREAGETQLFVKQVKVEGIRTIVCRNEEEAENDRKEREAIVMAALDAQLKKGDKALIGNSACRRYLRKAGARNLLRELRALLMEGVLGRQGGRLVSRRAELDWLAGLPDRRGRLYSDSARAIAFRNGPLV